MVVRRKDGELLTGIMSGRLIYINSTPHIISIFRDITDRKKAELALENNKKCAERFLNVAAGIILSLDSEGTIKLLNDSGHKILGYQNGELIGKSWFNTCLKPELQKEIQIVFEKLKKGENGIIELHENQVLTKSGEEKYILWHNTALFDNNNQFTGTLSSGEDITERKLSEEKLMAEKERLAVTLESIGDGVITTNTAGEIVIINKAAEELTGWKSSEALGAPVYKVFNIVDETTELPRENPINKVLESGHVEELSLNTLLLSKNGTKRIIADSAAPIKNRENKIIGVVLVFRDMTEKRKLVEAIQKAHKLESIGILAGGIAHDFNNLLSGVFGYIDMAKLVAKDDKIFDYLSKASSSIHRAKELTQQLLTFSRGGTPVKKTEHLFPFIRETVQSALNGSLISSHFNVDKNLWPASFDKSQIVQVIDNLVVNAKQAMPTGGKIIVSAKNVTLEKNSSLSTCSSNFVKISIQDTGTGIPKKIIDHIFDPFFTTKTQAHGLGLATCYSIINKHNGKIEVESEPGDGATFHFYLPASSEQLIPKENKTDFKHIAGGRILVMDDEPILRSTISDILQLIGYDSCCVSDGREAVKTFIEEQKANRNFDAMIFDLTVPGGMGGIEAAGEIKKINHKIPIFVTSGYAEDPAMANPAKYGFIASISKPFIVSELSEILRNHL